MSHPERRPGGGLSRRKREQRAYYLVLASGGLAVAAVALLGRGPGLTPEGDDLLAGVCVTAAAAGDPLALPPRVRALTTPLSATLLELAAQGAVAEPVHAVLTADRWRAALARLTRLGHSTGRAYAVNAAASARALG